LEEAEASFRQALVLKPGYAQAYSNLGNALQELDRLDDAEASYRQALALKPDYAEAHGNLGNTLRELGRLDEAEASLRQAIELKPNFADAYLNLCSFFEVTNNIDKLLLTLKEARTKTTDMAADFLFYETLVSFRKEHYSEAIKLIAQVDQDDVSEIRKKVYYKLKGDLYHYNKDYDAAFLAYENSNRVVKAGVDYKRQREAAEHLFDSERNKVRQLRQLSKENPYSKKIFSDGRQPTFLIGFPRSGTTLLDTILRTHSKISVVEEQRMSEKMHSALGSLQKVSTIEEIDTETAKLANDAYFKELYKHTTLSDTSIVIDKLPLNILKVPLISQVFPDAKFILALRHPLDCILSCWMQTFKLTPAMGNMVDLERIVDFYCTAMDILKFSQERYQLDVHRVRYEDLIENFEGEASSILSFLKLEWEDELLNYQSTALAREKINTPSHSQVIKPIYKTASNRWKHYAKYLKEFKTQVGPWLEEYGY
jgi:tetratricopeptide (TPR) repeat protein